MRPGRTARVAPVLFLIAGTSALAPPAIANAAPRTTMVGAAAPAGRVVPVAETAPLRIHLAGVSPAVALPGRPVTLTVRITNTSPEAVRGVVLRVRRGERALRTREEVRRWDAEALAPGGLRALAERAVPGSIAPGSTAAVSITLPAGPLPSDPYGAAPLELQSVTGTHAAHRRTFLPYFRIKEYTPLDIAFAAPLTGDTNPALYSTSATERAAAWTRMLGAEGRLTRILDGTAGAPVTFLLDPAVVGADRAAQSHISQGNGPTNPPLMPGPPTGSPASGATTAATPSATLAPTSAGASEPTSGPTPGSTTPATTSGSTTPGSTTPGSTTPPEGTTPAAVTTSPTEGTDQPDETQRLQSALATRLQTERSSHPLWLLPAGDPDLAALTAHPHQGELMRRLLSATTTPFGPDLPRVAWPVTPADDVSRATITAAYGATPPAAYLTPIGPLDQYRASQAAAPHRDAAGRLVLGYDQELSRLWGALADRAAAVETTQRFLAESAALLAQSPSRRRSVLVVAPRLFDADPAAQQAFLQTVRDTPWVNAVDAGTLLDPTQPPSPIGTGTVGAAPPHAGPGGTATPDDTTGSTGVPGTSNGPAPASGSPTTPPGAIPTSPLTGADLSLVEEHQRYLSGVASIMTQPDPAVRTLQSGSDALAATVWRWNPRAWARLRAAQAAAVRRYVTGVSVRPSAVNFFADSGVLQVTVVNELDRDVRGLTLTLNPEGRASRLRILAQPDPVQIRRNSRTTVRATVEAIAAGAVPVSTRLTTPEGITLGNDATVRVTVQPTNGWAVLAVGGLAGVVFLAGLYRTLRGGKPRMTSEELNRIDLT